MFTSLIANSPYYIVNFLYGGKPAVATVTTLTANAAAKIDNKGTIAKADVNADNVVLAGSKPKEIAVEDGVKAPTDEKGKDINPAEPPKDSGSGGGGGGGGGGGNPVTPSAKASTLSSLSVVPQGVLSWDGYPSQDKVAAIYTLSGTQFTAAGTLEKVTGFTGFSSVVEEQTGYYAAIRIEIPSVAFTASDAVIWYGTAFQTSQVGTAFTAGNSNLDLVLRVAAPEAEQLTPITFRVDWDGAGMAYTPTTYTVDLSKVLMKTAEGIYANGGMISFDSNGGTAVPKTPVALNGTPVSAPITPSKENHTFAGWYKENTLTTPWDFANDVVHGNATLYAKWTLVTPPVLADITLVETPQSVVYTGEKAAFVISSGQITTGFSISYNQGAGEVTPIHAGSYHVVITRPADLAYNAYAKTISNGLIITKADQAAPEGLAGVPTTATGVNDGKMTGTTAAMEYSKDFNFLDPAPVACTDTETASLAPGSYYVRFQATENRNAGASTLVRVYEICAPATTQDELIARLAAYPKASVSGTITLTKDVTVPAGKTLEVAYLQKLIISSGVTLTLEGAVTGTGTITNGGTIVANNQGALEAALKLSGAVKLGADISSLTKTINISKKQTVAFDLNGHTLGSGAVNATVFLVSNGSLTINDSSSGKTGRIEATNTNGSAIEMMGGFFAGMNANATVIINGGSIEGDCAIRIQGFDAKLYVNDGTITSRNSAGIMGDGSSAEGENSNIGTYIEVNGGTILGNTTNTAKYRYSGIYHPQTGALKITGGTVKGSTGAGVVMCSGDLTITGGSVEGHGSVTPNQGFLIGNGHYTFCGGVELNYFAAMPKGIGNITISGGTITSETSSQVLKVGEKTGAGTISITGSGIAQPVLQPPIGSN